MSSAVEEACKNVIAWVELAVSPTTNRDRRTEAYNAFEDFKENSPVCAQCGFALSTKGNHSVVRHIGLQLVEHCIKLRWNVLCPAEKVFIKESVMKLFTEGTEHLLTEKTHIKDALSKLLVEMIKREWPQQWPSLMEELHALCLVGETQKELVLLTLLRLAEDVVELQSVQGQRRRDLYQALTSNLPDMCSFFLNTLDAHYTKYRDLKERASTEEEKTELALHRQLTETTLQTLSGFVEWMPMAQVMAGDRLLPRIFCFLLGDDRLRICAAECLVQILARKGKQGERQPLLLLFNRETLDAVFSAASNAAANGALEEQHFVFLKKLCHITAHLGLLLTSLWSSETEKPSLELFQLYLDALFALLQHPSQAVNHITLPVWCAFFKHPEISALDPVRNLLPKFLKLATEKLVRYGFPSKDDSPACAYARLEFDGDEDFAPFFGKFRTDMAETVRLATLLNPIAGFQTASQWLQTLLAAKIEGLLFSVHAESDGGFCSPNSPSSIRWDALVQFMDGVFSRILSSPNPTPSAEEGIFLMEALLNFETQDPTILSYALSCISTLGVFLTLAPGVMPKVLNKASGSNLIFSAAVFSLPGQCKNTRSRAVRNLRRHACSGLVKLCKLHPRLVMPCFEQICSAVKRMQGEEDQLSQLENCTLMEALLVLSNEMHDFKRQSEFVVEVVSPAVAILTKEELKQALSSTDGFLAFVGMTEAPIDLSTDDDKGYNRSQLVCCFSMLMALIKRCHWPSDLEASLHTISFVAKKGGYYCEKDGAAYCRHPATRYMVSLLPSISLIMRTYNLLWTKEAKAKVHPAFTSAFDIHDSERNTALGGFLSLPLLDQITDACSLRLWSDKGLRSDVDFSEPFICKQPLERVKSFMFNIQDYGLQILGNAGHCLGPEFYHSPGLCETLLGSALAGLDQLPDYRLRPIIHILCLLDACPFVLYCPHELQGKVLLPLMKVLFPFMFQKLNSKWENFRLKYGHCADYEDEMTEEQELLEDQLNRLLSREYLDLLAVVLLSKRQETVPSDTMDEESEVPHVPPGSAVISEFGALVLKTEDLCASVVMTVFNALHWSDTTVSFKAITLATPLLKHMQQEGVIRDEQGASYLLRCVMQGLQVLGEHDINQGLLVGLALSLYLATRPLFPGVSAVLLTIPGCTPESLAAFEERLGPGPDGKQTTEKKKKELFRKLISPIIGKNIGQQFKAAIEIMNLPPIFRPLKMIVEIDDSAAVDNLPALFARDET
ncbi:unnamed protein product [Ixodes hexagonus]